MPRHPNNNARQIIYFIILCKLTINHTSHTRNSQGLYYTLHRYNGKFPGEQWLAS